MGHTRETHRPGPISLYDPWQVTHHLWPFFPTCKVLTSRDPTLREAEREKSDAFTCSVVESTLQKRVRNQEVKERRCGFSTPLTSSVALVNSLTKQTPPLAPLQTSETLGAPACRGCKRAQRLQRWPKKPVAQLQPRFLPTSCKEESQALPQARDAPLPDAGPAMTAVSIS